MLTKNQTQPIGFKVSEVSYGSYPKITHFVLKYFPLDEALTPSELLTEVSKLLGSSYVSAGDSFPKMNVWKEESKYYVAFSIAGYEKESIKIEINENSELVISSDGMQRAERKYITRELTTKAFTKTILLPEYVDNSSVKSEYADGIVTLSFDFLPEKKAIQIKI